MRKPILILTLVLAACGLSACAEPPAKASGGPEAQREHAGRAQNELSSEVRK